MVSGFFLGDESSSASTRNGSVVSVHQPETMPSGIETPSKKRVEWLLPEEPDHGGPSISSNRNSIDRGEREATPEDVRNFLHKISSTDAEIRPRTPGQPAAAGHRLLRPGKSALRRSGDSTPVEYPYAGDYSLRVTTSDNAGSEANSAIPRNLGLTGERPTLSRSPSSLDIDNGLATGQTTPYAYEDYDDYVPRPRNYRFGGLTAVGLLRKARKNKYGADDARKKPSPRGSTTSLTSLMAALRPGGNDHISSRQHSSQWSTPSLGGLVNASTAQLSAYGGSTIANNLKGNFEDPKWSRSSSTDSLSTVAQTSNRSGKLHSRSNSKESLHHLGSNAKRPSLLRTSSSAFLTSLAKLTKSKGDVEARITRHVQETIQRQRFLLRLCNALMLYGAPTHRLEEYMRASARILEIEAQFLYIPGCMIVSFDDSRSHTTEVKLVRTVQGLDLGKLRDTQEVYKHVIHDVIGVKEASARLTTIEKSDDKFNIWLRVLCFGLASASVGPFAFGARLIDLPIAFILGAILGMLQLVVAPKAELWTNVFELVAVVLTTFLARFFGSLHGGNLFCFSALAQSSIALILPGYLVLSAALELQSRSIIAGSVRLVYAIFYSLFLGFGLALGAALYGLIDGNATSATTCSNSIPKYWFFISVPIFTLTLLVINQAKFGQMPLMLGIAFAGYVVNYFTSQHFAGNTQISSMVGAFTMSIIANVYGRAGYRLHDAWERMDICNKLKRTSDTGIAGVPHSSSDLEKQSTTVLSEESTTRFRRKFFEFRCALGSIISRPFTRTPSSDHSTTSQAPNSQSTDSTTTSTVKAVSRRSHRLHYSMSAVLILPGIFVQVPSGLAIAGSLVSGIASANQITGNSTGSSTLTSGDVVSSTAALAANSVAFNVAYSVLEVAIGITVGLFLGSLVVYPVGKGRGWGKGMRGGLFSF